MWLAEPAIILAGGPSIRKHPDLARLQGVGRIIAINRALELPLEPDIWLWMDQPFYTWAMESPPNECMRRRAREFPGLRVTRVKRKTEEADDGIYRLRWKGGRGIGPSFAEGVYIGNNSGYWALNIAYAAGANPIILFGYDCQPSRNGKQRWWHDGYAPRKPGGGGVYNRMKQDFEDMAPKFTEAGATILNCSPGTALQCFPVIETIDELFERLEEMGHVV